MEKQLSRWWMKSKYHDFYVKAPARIFEERTIYRSLLQLYKNSLFFMKISIADQKSFDQWKLYSWQHLQKAQKWCIWWYDNKVKLATIVESDPKAPFSLAITLMCMRGSTPYPGLLHFTLDPYLIILSVKQRGITYPFLSLWYDSIWDWSPVSQMNTLPTKGGKKCNRKAE